MTEPFIAVESAAHPEALFGTIAPGAVPERVATLERETRTRSLAGWRMVGQCSPGPGVIVCTWERSRSSP